MGTTPIYGFPYPDPSDLVANYPALGQQLAEDVEAEIAASSQILQVVHYNYSTEFTTTSGTPVDMGLSGTITPASATNKILCIFMVQYLSQTTDLIRGQLVRDSTIILGSSRISNIANVSRWGGSFLDSPATTSSTTYKIQVNKDVAGGTAFVTNWTNQQTSTLTLMEVKA